MQDEYDWLWLYAAVEPTTGTGVFLLLPSMEGHSLEIFLRHLPPYSPELFPVEQVFRYMRKHLFTIGFTTFDDLQNALIEQLQQ